MGGYVLKDHVRRVPCFDPHGQSRAPGAVVQPTDPSPAPPGWGRLVVVCFPSSCLPRTWRGRCRVPESEGVLVCVRLLCKTPSVCCADTSPVPPLADLRPTGEAQDHHFVYLPFLLCPSGQSRAPIALGVPIENPHDNRPSIRPRSGTETGRLAWTVMHISEKTPSDLERCSSPPPPFRRWRIFDRRGRHKKTGKERRSTHEKTPHIMRGSESFIRSRD